MPRSSWAQTDFTGGEFSPFLDARIEAKRYATAMGRCLNYYPMPEGPLLRRPGSRFVHPTKDNGVAKLIRFKFSQTQNYQIEFGNLYARFYRNNGLVLETSQSITSVTTGATTVINKNSHGYSNGNRVFIAGLVGNGAGAVPLSFLNNREYVVANATANTFEIQIPPSTAINSTTYDAYSSGGTVARIYEIVTTYATADLSHLKTRQSLDTLYIGCTGKAPRKLTRTADTSWTLSTITFLNGPYLSENSTSTTLTPSAVGPGSVTITASATTGINGGSGFQTTDVGRLIRIQDAELNWVQGTITARTDTTHVTVNLETALASLAARATWRLGAWSDSTSYPTAPNFFEDRLGWGGSTTEPQRLDYSRSGDYENYLPTDADGTVGDDHALTFVLNSGDVNSIVWQESVNGAIEAGTPAGEWLIKSAYESEPLTPTSVFASQPTTEGSLDAMAEKVNAVAVFVHRGQRRLNEIVYDRGSPTHQVNDLSELAYHLAAGGLEEVVFQQVPHRLLWVRKTDGGLLGCTYKRNSDSFFAGWQEHRLGGGTVVSTLTYGDDTYSLYAKVLSISVIPSTQTKRDELWMIVERIIGGNTVRYVEYLDAPFDNETTFANANHLDSSQKVTSGSDITAVSGLYYFEGQTLNTWVNGAAGPDVTVTNGKFTLSGALAARTVIFGYKSTAQGAMLRPEAGAADGGPALGKSRRVHKAVFNLYRSLGISVSVDSLAIWDDLDIASSTSGYTGLIETGLSSDDSLEGRITWRQTGPEPGLIRSITGLLDEVDDG